MRKRPLTAAFVARVKTPGRYGDGGHGGLGLYLRVHRMTSGASPGPGVSGFEWEGSPPISDWARTRRDAQGGEREGAGEQAVDPLGPRSESRRGSHLRGGRREVMAIHSPTWKNPPASPGSGGRRCGITHIRASAGSA